MNLDEEGNNEELIRLASQGDPESVAALARRSISSLFDFAIRVTLDEAAARAIAESTLGRALSELDRRPPNLAFRTWMFGIARDEALDNMRTRGRDGADSTQLSPLDERFIHLDDSSRDAEMALWTWQAARAQRPRDYSLLDLAIRRRIPPEEIADIASLSRSGIYAVLGRLRGAFEESFFTSTLYFRGRPDCAELEKLVTEASSLGPALRRDLGRHAESCAICKETRNGLTLAADILGSFSNVTVPRDLVERLAPAPAEASVDATTADDFAAREEDVIDEPALSAALPDEVALDGQPMEERAETDEPAAEGLIEEAALLLPDVDPVGEPAFERAAEESFEQAADLTDQGDAREGEMPLPVPVAVTLAGAAGMTVLAAAEDALFAGSAATVEPRAPNANGHGSSTPQPATSTNGSEPPVAAGREAAAVLQPAGDQPIETAAGVLPNAESDEAVESTPSATSAGMPSGREENPDAADDAPDGAATPLGPVAAHVGATGLVAPDEAAAALQEADESGEPGDKALIVDEDGALTAVAGSALSQDREAGGGGALLPVGAGVAAGSAAGTADALPAGGGGGRPPRAHTSEGAEGGRSKGRRNLWLIAIIGVATVAAAYVGIALGDSIRSGGDTTNQPGVVLPTRAAGVREVACGTAPISMQQGTRATLTFASASLPGYEVANVAVQPISPLARTSSVEATAQQGLSVLFEAFTIPTPPTQVDEYRLLVTFNRDQERTSSECTVLVSAGPEVATSTPLPVVTPTEPPVTPTLAVPLATAVIIVPTQAVPTPAPSATPEPVDTPEPPTETPLPTNTPVPPTNTPTVTGTPPTATPPPTYTPTVTPTPTQTPIPPTQTPPPAP